MATQLLRRVYNNPKTSLKQPSQSKRRYLSDNEVYRQLCGNAPRTIMPELHHGDIHASNADDVPEAFAEYYRYLQEKYPVLNEAQVENLDREFMSTVSKNSRKLTKLDCTITAEEVATYFSSVKVKCCGGPDGSTPFIWKTLCECPELLDWMTEVFNVAFWSGQTPTSWKASKLSTLFKEKGARYDPANYRPISLTNLDYRAYASVLAHRFQSIADVVISPTQTGFVGGHKIYHNAHEATLFFLRRTGYALFLDMEKAYDTTPHRLVELALQANGFPPRFIAACLSTMQGTSFRVFLNQQLSGWVDVDCGIRQGCPLSPLLFILAIQPLLNKMVAAAMRRSPPTR